MKRITLTNIKLNLPDDTIIIETDNPYLNVNNQVDYEVEQALMPYVEYDVTIEDIEDKREAEVIRIEELEE